MVNSSGRLMGIDVVCWREEDLGGIPQLWVDVLESGADRIVE